MIEVNIEFRSMYEPGELAPPQTKTDGLMVGVELQALPRFKDQIKYNGHKYIVWDVVHRLEDKPSDLDRAYELSEFHNIQILATRKVFTPLEGMR